MKKLTIEEARNIMEQNHVYLDLSCTKTTTLPDNFTSWGSLDLGCAEITTLPDNLTVGGYLNLSCTRITTLPNNLTIGGCIHWGCLGFSNNCKNFREGVNDLAFKNAMDRGAEQYRNIGIDEPILFSDAVTMYRIITGACKAGTQSFIDNMGEIKSEYTPREIIEMTSGQYGGEVFRNFFRDRT